VDDGAISGPDLKFVEFVLDKLGKKFKIKDMGHPENFLGMEIHYEKQARILTISQKHYIAGILEKFGHMVEFPKTTPMSSNFFKMMGEHEHDEYVEVPYRQLLGNLLWASVCTRPDLSFSVNMLSQFLSKPTKFLWEALLRVVAYLMNTREIGLVFSSKADNGMKRLLMFVDSEWAGDPITRKSIGGYLMFLENNLIAWNARKQQGLVALSSTESEYLQIVSGVKEILWIQPILKEIGLPDVERLTIIFEDNIPAIKVLKDERSKGRTKHFDVKLKFVKEAFTNNVFKIVYVPSQYNLADIMTKPLGVVKYRDLRAFLVNEIEDFLGNMSRISAFLNRYSKISGSVRN
jgi:hypothetical protein